MTSLPLPEPLESEVAIGEPVVVYRCQTLILQRHPETLARTLFTAVLKEPVTTASYNLLTTVLDIYAPPGIVQVGAGDFIGKWLWLDFEEPELPKPRLAS